LGSIRLTRSFKVKNEEGLGDLFTGGDFVPSGNINAYTGLSFSNAITGREKYIKKIQKKYDDKLPGRRTALTTEFTRSIKLAVKGLKSPRKEEIKKDLTDALAAAANVEEFHDGIKDKKGKNEEEQEVYDNVIQLAKKRQEEFTKEKAALNKKKIALRQGILDLNFHRFLLYGFGGPSYLGFKQFTKIDSSNLANSFVDKQEAGGSIGVGVNYQFRNFWFGATYSYEQSNNFALLSKKEYSLKGSTTAGGKSLSEESKITAYSGTYGKVDINNFNVDIVGRFAIDTAENRTYLLVNPYMRASIFSRDTSLLPNKINLGMGFYFIKNDSKFLGGFYIELPDVTNNAEKKKAVEVQNIRPPYKKLTFGIVTKFNLSALMRWNEKSVTEAEK
jgi:hypothetical protein